MDGRVDWASAMDVCACVCVLSTHACVCVSEWYPCKGLVSMACVCTVCVHMCTPWLWLWAVYVPAPAPPRVPPPVTPWAAGKLALRSPFPLQQLPRASQQPLALFDSVHP